MSVQTAPRIAATVLLACAAVLGPSGAAVGASPEVVLDSFSGTFPDSQVMAGCAAIGSNLSLTADLVFDTKLTRFRDTDGTVTLELVLVVVSGTVTNDVTGGQVLVDIRRTWHDDFAAGQSRMTGRQVTFRDPDGGVLLQQAGTLVGDLYFTTPDKSAGSFGTADTRFADVCTALGG